MTKLLQLNDSVLKREEATEVVRTHALLQKKMLAFEQRKSLAFATKASMLAVLFAPAARFTPLLQVPAVSPNPKLLVNSFHCCICRLYRDERCLCNAADKGGPVKRR